MKVKFRRGPKNFCELKNDKKLEKGIKIFILFLFIILGGAVKANNIQISNISVVPANNTIKFDVSWENGWRSGVLKNWDAAWVFFKFKNIGDNWDHLNLTNTANIIPAGFSVGIGTAGSGAMLFRSSSGSGTTTLTNVELGIAAAQASGIYDIKAFAIEMVYIPGGSFFVGDGDYLNGGVNATVTYAGGVDVFINPYTNPNFIMRNGFNAFYCMKYELSQGGYRDFLNTLTYNQQINHVVSSPSAATGTAALFNLNRNYLKIKTPGVPNTTPALFGCDADGDNIFDEVNDGEAVACNFLNWPDHAAYLAWAGLMPMSEFEYEKAARGIALPVNAEYAWGTTQAGTTTFNLTNPGLPSEIVSNSSSTLGNANFQLTSPNSPYDGPIRNGIFGTSTSNRIISGGGFYGVMELSGNLWERVTSFYHYLTYSSVNPGQNLESVGYAYRYSGLDWPGSSVGNRIDGSVNATGLLYRGGGWESVQPRLEASDRGGLNVSDPNTDRSLMNNVGIRGIVSIP